MLKAAVKGLGRVPGGTVPHVYGNIDDGAEREGHCYICFKDRVLFIGGWAFRGGLCRAAIEDQGTEHGVQNDCWDIEHLKPFGQMDCDQYRLYHRLKENCDFPPRCHMAVCVVGDHLYLCGGRADPVRHDFLNDLWKSTDGIDWEVVHHDAPWKPRHSHALVPCNDGTKDFLMMGGQAGRIQDGWETFNDVWRFVAAESKWEQVTEHAGWMARATPTVKAGRAGEIVLIGGEAILPVEPPARECSDGSEEYFGDVWVTRDCGRTWECAAEAPPFPPTKEAWFDHVASADLYIIFGKRSGFVGSESRVWTSRDLREWTVSSELVVEDMIDEVALNNELIHCLKKRDGTFVFMTSVLQ